MKEGGLVINSECKSKNTENLKAQFRQQIHSLKHFHYYMRKNEDKLPMNTPQKNQKNKIKHEEESIKKGNIIGN